MHHRHRALTLAHVHVSMTHQRFNQIKREWKWNTKKYCPRALHPNAIIVYSLHPNSKFVFAYVSCAESIVTGSALANGIHDSHIAHSSLAECMRALLQLNSQCGAYPAHPTVHWVHGKCAERQTQCIIKILFLHVRIIICRSFVRSSVERRQP